MREERFVTFKHKPYEGNEPYVFVSYCREDSALCEELLEFLEENHIRVWFDNAIHVGDKWPEVIANHLKSCQVCILLITRNFVNSVNCNNELNFSGNRGIPIIPMIVDGTNITYGMELMLSATQYIKLSKSGKQNFKRVLESDNISACIDGNAAKHTGLLVLPGEGKAYEFSERLTIASGKDGKLMPTYESAASAHMYVKFNADGSLVLEGGTEKVYYENGILNAGEEVNISSETWLQLGKEFAALLPEKKYKPDSSCVAVLESVCNRECRCVIGELELGSTRIWPKGTLKDKYVVPINAVITEKDGSFYIRDAVEAGQAYGTAVNRRFLAIGENALLHEGDLIQLGETLLRMRILPIVPVNNK